MSKLFAKRNSEPVTQPSQIRVAKSAYRKILLKRIFAILGYSAVGVFIIYLCFASTIMRIVPTVSGSGMVAVKENTYRGGTFPAGETILVDTVHAQGDGYVQHLKQAFVPTKNAAVVQVVAGPFDTIQWMESGLVIVDGSLSSVYLPDQPKNDDGSNKDRLKNEYLSICISGDCVPGEGVITPKDNIYGLTLADYGVTSNVTIEKGDS